MGTFSEDFLEIKQTIIKFFKTLKLWQILLCIALIIVLIAYFAPEFLLLLMSFQR